MKRPKIIIFWLLFLVIPVLLNAGEKVYNPRIGIVISKLSFEQRWGIVQMSAHGWTGVAHLAGLPYDNLFLEELSLVNPESYNAIIMTQCSHVERDKYPELLQWLEGYTSGGGNLIIDGLFADFDESGKKYQELHNEILPGIVQYGFYGDNSYRIKIINNQHKITDQFPNKVFVTQHLTNGVNGISFTNDGYPLLVVTNEENEYPYLSVRDNGTSRTMLISDFATYSGATSLFRNVHPQVFYKNELFNVLIRGLQWIVYGDIDVPIPAPQLSNANLTSVIRLDADASGNLESQIKTIDYLVNLANETGVVPLYAWVSSAATRAGWQELARLGHKIENIGGRIGTHSKYHRINADMTPERWVEELDGSIDEIESNTALYGYPVKGVAYMINPGNTIRMNDYDEVSRRISFFMTHGFEQNMPIGFGNMTWFTGEEKNFVVINNTPSPDYQWFNDPTWSYTTAQITAYQESIFDHLNSSIGRGLVYNQMWHDYAITTLPQSLKDRIINESNIAMYDAMWTKFYTSDIYAAEPEDLAHKIRAMKQWDYEWSASSDRIEIKIDLSNVLHEDIPDHIGGMGLRIDNTRKYINNITINGLSSSAYNDSIVILPNLIKGINSIIIDLGTIPSSDNRLAYISKRMPGIINKENDLRVDILTNSRGRFMFLVHEPSVLLHADFQEWNRRGDYQLRGYVNSDRTIILRPSHKHGIGITYATIPIINYVESDNYAVIQCGESIGEESLIRFIAKSTPKKITLNNQIMSFSEIRSEVEILLPDKLEDSILVIYF
jgi:hypothetical protein